MRKLLVIAFAAVLLLGLAAVLIARFVLTNYLTADHVVAQLEASLNCRAEIGEMDLKLFRRPSRIVLTSVALAPRDKFAKEGTPLADRSPLEDFAMHCDSVTLEARLADLLRRKLTIDRLLLDNFKAQVLLHEDGTNSLDTIFSSPERHDEEAPVLAVQPEILPQTQAETPPPAGSVPLAAAESAAPPPAAVAAAIVEEGEPFRAGDLPVATFADIVEIDGGTVYAKVVKNGSSILIDNIQLTATDIDLDPAALDSHNRATLRFSALIGVDSTPEEGVRYAELRLKGEGTLVPFNAGNGFLDPRFSTTLTIREGSYVDTLPTLDSVAGLFEKIEEFGIDVGEMDLRGDFTQASATQIEYYGGIVKTTEEARLHLRDNQLKLSPGSWINANSNAHLLEGSVIVSEAKTAEAIEEVDKFLQKKASIIASPDVRNMILKPVMKDGRVTLGFRSSGDLNQPRVDLLTEMGTISNILKFSDSEEIERIEKEGKKLLKGLKDAFGF